MTLPRSSNKYFDFPVGASFRLNGFTKNLIFRVFKNRKYSSSYFCSSFQNIVFSYDRVEKIIIRAHQREKQSKTVGLHKLSQRLYPENPRQERREFISGEFTFSCVCRKKSVRFFPPPSQLSGLSLLDESVKSSFATISPVKISLTVKLFDGHEKVR